jgi:ABC-2 type transport system permease protein
MVSLIVLFSALFGLLTDEARLSTADTQRDLLSTGGTAGIFTALAGVLLVTSEYRFGTIRPTFLFTARRSRVIAAKILASLFAGFLLAVAGQFLGLAAGLVILHGRDIPVVLDSSSLALSVLGTLAGVSMWGAIGVGLGAIVRNQLGAITGVLAWAFIAENLLTTFAPALGGFAPGPASNALAGVTTEHMLNSPSAGGAVLAAWVALLAFTAVVLIARRDVA